MCGIVGEWSHQLGEITSPEVVTDLTAMMTRRGPDDVGHWSDRRRCQLGFRRLSILDLTENGHQPMISQDQRYVLVFNGEVYNFPELREQLKGQGVSFRSTGDAEVVLNALATWGKPALNRFNGMFALAFFDTAKQSLLLARDHAGIKPLYYSNTRQGVVFGSQYNQIISHPWNYPSRPSASGLALYLQSGLIPSPYAILEDTYAVEPGQWIEVAPNRTLQTGNYFSLPRDTTPDLHAEEAVDALEAAVSGAVGRCLLSDVPVGCFLSGGIDSPVVASAIHRHVGEVPAFTIGTAGDRHDETDDARRYAEEIGHSFVHRQLDPKEALQLVDDVAMASSEPFADPSIFPTLLVSQLASQHVKVVLSGDGADELLWGYAGRYATFLQKAGEFRRASWLRACRWKLNHWIGRNRELPFWPGISAWHQWKTSRLRSPLVQHLLPDLTEDAIELRQFATTPADEASPASWLRWNEYYLGMQTILAKVDRASMHHSLEVRVPLLDREVIDVCTRIGVNDCLDANHVIGKLPLRAMLKRSIRHQTRNKRGFRISMDNWLRTELRPLMEDLLLGTDSILGFSFRRDVVEQVIHQHVTNQRNYARELWTLLSLRLWEENHYRGRQRFSRVASTNANPLRVHTPAH
ncbi:MAG: asparagine synthase (glutamine-hydrolyzing) [Planctomycetota bacterium]|nr:asparagine synthase (glutamine-hydrolyzing) [Planctomycetota bacterium]